MVNPEIDEFFCPRVKGTCVGRKCIAMKKKTYNWTTEDCVGYQERYTRDYLECRHYPEVQIWLS